MLETERLRLREYRKEDFAAVAAMWSDPVVIRHTTGRPLSPEEAWAKTLRNAGLWLVVGYGYWALEEKATGQFIGEVGLAEFHREIQPSIVDTPEMGWLLVASAHGKGYGTEAIRAAIRWGHEHLDAVRICCLIHCENAASVRVAEKCGFREFQRSTYHGNEVIMMQRSRREAG